MPQIPIYQSRVSAPRPDESVAGAFARGGEVIGGAFQEAGQAFKSAADKFQELQNRSEIADMTANLAKTRADLEVQWQQKLRQSDPNDPNFKNLAQDFMDNVAGPAFDEVGKHVTTNEATFAYRQASGIMRADMLRTAVEGQTTISGQFAATRLVQLNNELGGGVYRNPTFFDTALNLQKLATEGAVHNSGLSEAEKLKLDQDFGRALVTEAFTGAAAAGGSAAVEKMIDDPKYDPYMSRSDRYQLLRDAQRQDSIQKAADRENEREASEQRTNTYYNRMVVGPDGSATFRKEDGSPGTVGDFTNDLLHDPSLKPTERDSIIGMAERLAKRGDKASESKLMSDFIGRMSLDTKDPNYPTQQEIMQNVGVEGGLSKSDAGFLIRRLTGATPRSKAENAVISQAVRTAHAAISPASPFGGQDPEGEYNMQRFDAWFYPALDAGIAEGKDITRQLLNPDSPDYLMGKNNSVLAHFGMSTQGGFDAQMRAIQQQSGGNTTAPSKPTKSISDFMKGL